MNELRSIGIQPDIIVCRSDRPISPDLKDKIALFTDVEARAVISCVGRSAHLLRTPQPARRGPGRAGGGQAGSGDRARAARRMDRSGRQAEVGHRHGAHRPGGQVRQAAGRLSERRRGAQARRHPPRPQPGDHLGGRRDAQAGGDHLPSGVGRRHPGPGRLRRPGHRGQDHVGVLRAREQGALPGPVPGSAGGGGRVRPPRGRHAGGELVGVRPLHARTR